LARASGFEFGQNRLEATNFRAVRFFAWALRRARASDYEHQTQAKVSQKEKMKMPTQH
jgi:hypothetical protein